MKNLTTARAFIFETLEENKDHMTAYQVYETVKPRLPSLNMSTVYRSLEYLTQKGMISVADVGENMPVYEVVSDPHHHLVCQKCGNILLVDHAPVKKFFDSVSEEYHFEIQTNHLILFGVCKDCQ